MNGKIWVGALAALGSLSILSGCGTGPEPSFIAPAAISDDGGTIAIAFCEDTNLTELRVSQELAAWDSDFIVLFEAGINQLVAAGDVLRLD